MISVLISHRYKFVYLKNKKVAGSSVESVFQKYCLAEGFNGLRLKPKDEVPFFKSDSGIISGRLGGAKEGSKWQPHSSAKKVLKEIRWNKFNFYFKFSVVRLQILSNSL